MSKKANLKTCSFRHPSVSSYNIYPLLFAPKNKFFRALDFPRIFGQHPKTAPIIKTNRVNGPDFLPFKPDDLQNMSTHRCGKHPQVRIQNLPDIGVGETLCRSWASNSACNLTTRISCSKPGIWECFLAKL